MKELVYLMSTSAAVSVKVSEKFKKEVLQFFTWASENYIVKFKDVDEKDWNFNLVKKFEEPARNKLVMYIKAVMDNHSIVDNEDVRIDDAKLMVKDFKENGKKSKTENPKKEKRETKKILVDMNVDMSLDTTETYYLSDIEATTETLEAYFGCKAEKTGKKGDDHQYEWKFQMEGHVYSVYDWCYVDGSFDRYDSTDWYLGGDTEQNIEKIRKEVEQKVVEKSKVEKKKKVDKEKVGEDLFGDDIDIDIDKDDDIEINLDAIIGETDEIDWD